MQKKKHVHAHPTKLRAPGGRRTRTNQLATPRRVCAARFRQPVDARSIFDSAAGLQLPSRRRATCTSTFVQKKKHVHAHPTKLRAPGGRRAHTNQLATSRRVCAARFCKLVAAHSIFDPPRRAANAVAAALTIGIRSALADRGTGTVSLRSWAAVPHATRGRGGGAVHSPYLIARRLTRPRACAHADRAESSGSAQKPGGREPRITFRRRSVFIASVQPGQWIGDAIVAFDLACTHERASKSVCSTSRSQ